MVEVELTEAGKRWILEHYPQGIVWEYDVDKLFKLLSLRACTFSFVGGYDLGEAK